MESGRFQRVGIFLTLTNAVKMTLFLLLGISFRLVCCTDGQHTSIKISSGEGDYTSSLGNGARSADVHTFVRSGKPNAYERLTNVTHVIKMLHPESIASDEFSINVAVEGDTMVLGAYWGSDDGSYSGSAHVFTRDVAGELKSTWSHRSKLLAPVGERENVFGWSVAVDGDTIVVGAIFSADNGIDNCGSAHIFTRDVPGDLTSTWSHQSKIGALDGSVGSYLGVSVAISLDTIILGAYYGDYKDIHNQGTVHIFTRDVAGERTSTWSHQAKLVSPDSESDNYFGWSVAIDGNTVVVGAHYSADSNGSAHVFIRDVAEDLQSTWSHQSKLLSPDATVGTYFGYSVALSGNCVVVGAPHESKGSNYGGSAHVFTRGISLLGDRSSPWSHQSTLISPDAVVGKYFGVSVAVSIDTIVVGAVYEGDGISDNGSVHVFMRDTGEAEKPPWSHQSKLMVADGGVGVNFGVHVSISGYTIATSSVDIRDGDDSAASLVFVFSWTTDRPPLLTQDQQRLVPFSGNALVGSQISAGSVNNTEN